MNILSSLIFLLYLQSPCYPLIMKEDLFFVMIFYYVVIVVIYFWSFIGKRSYIGERRRKVRHHIILLRSISIHYDFLFILDNQCSERGSSY